MTTFQISGADEIEIVDDSIFTSNCGHGRGLWIDWLDPLSNGGIMSTSEVRRLHESLGKWLAEYGEEA